MSINDTENFKDLSNQLFDNDTHLFNKDKELDNILQSDLFDEDPQTDQLDFIL